MARPSRRRFLRVSLAGASVGLAGCGMPGGGGEEDGGGGEDGEEDNGEEEDSRPVPSNADA